MICFAPPYLILFTFSLGYSEIEESYSDVINARELKKKQLLVHEFCLITMNNLAEVVCDLMMEDGDTHLAMSLINSSCKLFSEILELIQMLGFSESFHKRLEKNCRIAHQISEVLIEISEKLSKGLCFHKEGYSRQNMSEVVSYHRLSYISILKLVVKLCKISPHKSCKQRLDQVLKDSILDCTLYLSHEDLHHQIYLLLSESESVYKELLLFDSSKDVMKSMAKCIKLFKNVDSLSKSQLVGACNAALICYEWHESTSFVSLVIRLCRNTKLKTNEENEKKLLKTTLILILSHQDTRLRTTGYLELHNLIQDILGINRALDLDGSRKYELQFLLESPDVFEEIIQYGCIEESSEDKHINQAAQEIVLYLLKGKSVLGNKLWQIFTNNVIKPNTGLLNSLIEDDGSEGNRSNDTSQYLSKKILALFSPTIDENDFVSDADLMIDNVEILRSNIRLMFHKNSSVRHRANSNLKAMLSQEVNSYDKLPRFSEIIQTDLSDSTKFVFNRDLNKLVDLENDSTYLSPVVLRNCPPEDENVETLKKVLALLGRPSSEELDTTDNDTQLRRAALSRLEILLEDKFVQNYFFSHGKSGVDLLLSIWSKCLSETNHAYLPEQFVPSIVQCISILAFRDGKFREILQCSETFLFSCLRSLYIFHKRYEVKADIHDLLILVLFAKHIQIKPSENSTSENACGIYVPEILSKRFYIPFQHFMIEDSRTTSKKSIDDLYKIENLLKTFWNLAWFGCANELTGWSTTRVNRNNENISSDEVQIPEKLQLSDRELLVIQVSDVLCCATSCLNRMKSVKSHPDFHFHLQVLLACSLLTSSSEEAKCLLTVEWKATFHRFFTIKPGTIQDDKLFISISNFFSQLVTHLNNILKDEKRSEENNLNNFLNQSVIQLGTTNILYFLTRAPKNVVEENTTKLERCNELILKGNEQIGSLIMHLVDFGLINFKINSHLLLELIENFIQYSKDLLSHCHWPIKAITKILSSSQNMSTCIEISKTSRLLSKCKDAISLDSDQEKSKKQQLFLGSNITMNASKIIRTVIKSYSVDNDKTKCIILDSFSGNNKLKWLVDTLWQNRNTLVRTVGLGISNTLSHSRSGSDFLTCNGQSNESFWLRLVSIFLDRTECPNARSESINTMTNMIKRSLEDKLIWHGPTFVEPVSKLLVDGEGALFHFFDRLNVHREIVDILQAFSFQHCHKWPKQLEPINDSDMPHSESYDKERVNNDNSFTEMSNRSSEGSCTNFVYVESSVTPNLITAIIKLLQVILTLETDASNQLQEPSLLPNFDSKIIPVMAGLCFDASGPRTKQIIHKNISASNKKAYNLYIELTLEFLKLLSIGLKRQVNMNVPVEEFAASTDIMQLILDNDYTCQAMIVNTIYYFYNNSSVSDWHKVQLIAALFQQISVITRCKPVKDCSAKNNNASKHANFVLKYLTAFLEMTIFVLTYDELQDTDKSEYIENALILDVLQFIAECFRCISAANDDGRLQINNFRQKNQKLTEQLCHILLRAHTKIYSTLCKRYDARQKKLMTTSINMSLLEMFSVNSEIKMIYLHEESKNIPLHRSHMQDTLAKLGLIADRFKSAQSSRYVSIISYKLH